jgi:hypothetical protein
MRVRSLLPALLSVSLVLAGATRVAAQEIIPWLTYPVFALLQDLARLQAFNDCTPENRAELMRTHLQLWLDENRSRLSAEQIAQAEENLAFISPDLYRTELELDPTLQAQANDLATRSRALFSQEDLSRALWVTGDGWAR